MEIGHEKNTTLIFPIQIEPMLEMAGDGGGPEASPPEPVQPTATTPLLEADEASSA